MIDRDYELMREERDSALTECARLRAEVEALRVDAAERVANVVRERDDAFASWKSAEKDLTAERESRLRAEAGADEVREHANALIEANTLLEKQLSEEKAARLRAEAEIVSLDDCADNYANRLATAERERDEARAEVARFTGGPKCAGVDWHFKTADALAAAQKRIEGLEAALRDVAIPSLAYCEQKYGHDDASRLNCTAALSSPAVTAEGKKLGEEGGGA